MGVSEAYGRAIGTNLGLSSIAQSPPPEPELPLSQRRSEALAREGRKRAKLAKPTLRTSGSSMLTADQHKDPVRFPGDFLQDTSKRDPGELHVFQIDFQEPTRGAPRDFPIDLQEASAWMTLGANNWHTCSGKKQIPEIRRRPVPAHTGLARSLTISGAELAKPTLIGK